MVLNVEIRCSNCGTELDVVNVTQFLSTMRIEVDRCPPCEEDIKKGAIDEHADDLREKIKRELSSK